MAKVIEITKYVAKNRVTGSELRVLAADAPTSYGLRPRRLLFDELSMQENERLWLSMWTATAKSPVSQLVAASMCGHDFSSIAWRVREMSRTTEKF